MNLSKYTIWPKSVAFPRVRSTFSLLVNTFLLFIADPSDSFRDEVSSCNSKLDFLWASAQKEHPFEKSGTVVSDAVSAAIEWINQRSCAQVMAERERIVSKIEQLGELMIRDGRRDAWFVGADPHVAGVSNGVNGPLAMWLAIASDYHDREAIELFRKGAEMAGVLTNSGLGTPIDIPETPVCSMALRSECWTRNQELLSTLHKDVHCDELVSLMRKDVVSGRMSEPRAVADIDLENNLLMRRFGVEQGVRADGSIKIWACDDGAACGSNDCCSASERLHNDRHDYLSAVVQLFFAITSAVPAMWKCDVDAAFRRVPVHPEHRWMLWAVVLLGGSCVAAQHYALPFGCVASVHAWNRIGGFLAHVATKVCGFFPSAVVRVVCGYVLKLPVLRYVDDYLGLDRKDCVIHGLDCFARVVRCILGSSALAEEKMGVGITMEYLGICVHPSLNGISFWPSKAKITRWLLDIEKALSTGVLSSGDASKLVGRLAFANQVIFKRVGRAMLRPIYAQQHVFLRHGRISEHLRLSLKWWWNILALEINQVVPLRPALCRVVELFGDARGAPPRVASVLLADGVVEYTDWEPDSTVMNTFCARRDNQIMGQELLAVLFGLSTFLDKLHGSCVRVWIDNSGGESALLRGRATSWDHNILVHSIWLLAAKYNFSLWIERVPSKLNIADDPSREVYTTLEGIGARWVPPVLRREFWFPKEWLEQLPS